MSGMLRERLSRNETILGLCVMYPAAGIIESCAAGWDWFWIDGQHGQHDYRSLLECVRTADAMNTAAVVRVPGHEYGIIGPVMDMKPAGIMVPMVDTVAQAQQVVQAVRFPPLGGRSYGGRRVIDIGGRDYYQTEKDDCVLIAQIETLEAVKNAAAIAALDGVDVLFFGPDDMKARMGLPINTPLDESPELQAAMKQTADAALAAGKVAGTVAATPQSIQTAHALGYRLLIGGGDVVFLRTSAQAKLAQLQAALANDADPDAPKASGVY